MRVLLGLEVGCRKSRSGDETAGLSWSHARSLMACPSLASEGAFILFYRRGLASNVEPDLSRCL